jgi:hypothetical protein
VRRMFRVAKASGHVLFLEIGLLAVPVDKMETRDITVHAITSAEELIVRKISQASCIRHR